MTRLRQCLRSVLRWWRQGNRHYDECGRYGGWW